MAFQYLKSGNAKLGAGIFTLSLPPVKTCPGRGVCENFCYAVNLYRIYPTARAHWDEVHRRVQTKGWVDEFVEQAKANKKLDTVRVHVSGDFFSAGYVRDWIRIVKALPDVRFWAYTTSWKVSRILKALNKLRTEPNFQMYASVEPEEWDDKRLHDWPKALVIDGWTSPDDKPGIICPEQVYRHKTKMTMADKTKEAASCATCQYCIKGKGNVMFSKH